VWPRAHRLSRAIDEAMGEHIKETSRRSFRNEQPPSGNGYQEYRE
jgi:hypothetical protein